MLSANTPSILQSVRARRIALQVVFAVALIAGLYYLWFNLVTNMHTARVSTGWGFLDRPTGFRITGSDFRPSRPIMDAIAVGATRTLRIAAIGIMFATVLGIIVGVARLSTNWLVRRAAALYVEVLRNVPVLVVIIFTSAAVILNLPRIDDAIEWLDVIVLSNRGFWVPAPVVRPGAGSLSIVIAAALLLSAAVAAWRTRRAEATGRPHHRFAWGGGLFVAVAVIGYLALGSPIAVSVPERTGRAVEGGAVMTPEFGALLAGLVVYTASHIAEVVRGSILAVPRGQTEAATALGLRPTQRLRYVVLPQAFRVAVPPLANQYLNLTKNSSLAVAIGYAEVTRIIFIAIGNGNPAPQLIAVQMAVYLAISLAIALVTNLVNRRLQRTAR